jgi:hypothetical protein
MEGIDNMHPALLNGHVQCTLIESFSGEVFVVRPGFRKAFDKGLSDAKKFIDNQGWGISIFIIKGSPILRQMMTDDKC